ncbi:MAG: choice-of-anchor J domain-containing protein [Tannerellaceae bacterium]|jgi:M6 family metalloprotease-like protein|nr:choice-of-anchor J domain-containing protein [Tannerellaceae bacterium]
MVKNYLFILFLGALSLLARDVFAVTAVPWPVEKTQPDGTVISVYLRGDEQVHWMESMDGYTLMYDDQKYVVYAKQDERGNMVPSNIRYGGVGVQSTSPKGLRYSKDQVAALKQIWEVTSGPDAQNSSGQQKAGSTVGERKALCVLVGFSDKPFGKAKGDYEILFNQLNLYPADNSVKGSVRDFFRENSYGQLDFTVTVVGPYVADSTTAYYGDDAHYREFATFAATAADADVDYNDFADNGVLETFHILFAGYGDENINNGQQIWSHKWQLASPIYRDGVRISVYSCSPELRGSSGNNITYIGVICHELTHVFGAPDYYDTGNSGYPGTGYWDLMASGSWNDNGRQPSHINIFQKMLYEWVTPEALTTQKTVTGMPPSAQNPVAYTIQANDNGELYVLDNRQKTGFDASLPGHGLLIWHVHPAALGGSGSNAGHPQQLYPVWAASTIAIPNSSPSSYGPMGSPDTPFPGTSGKTSFAGTTTPAMFSWTGLQPVPKPVTEIAEAADGTISFKFLDGPTDPVTNLSATVTGNDVKLDWTPPARNDIQGYKIFRDGTLQFSTNNKELTTYTQISVPKGNYEYCVSVVYEVTESAGTCIPVAVTTGSDDFYLPVSDLQATAGVNNVTLSWTAPFTGGWTGIAGNPTTAYYFGDVWDFFAGTLWSPSDLKGLNGFEISKVKFVPIEKISDGASYAVVIYEVPTSGAPVEVYTQAIADPLTYSGNIGAYNEITLTTPYTVDATKGVIVGIQVHTVGGNCLPVSQGDSYPDRNIFYDVDGWSVLEDIDIPLGRNYCLQVYLDGTGGGSPVILPEPAIPANTSFLKKNSSKKLKAGEGIVNTGFSQAPSTVATYHIYRDGVEAGTSATTSYTDEGLTPSTAYAYCVVAEYADGGLSESVCIETQTDTPYKPVTNLTAQVYLDDVTLAWEPQEAYTVLFEESFESGIPAAWGNVDKDGDGYKWDISPVAEAQDGSSAVYSASYLYPVGALTPDNWLVTPAITLTDDNKLIYYVSAQDAGWAAEHYGVYISTSNTVPGTFTELFGETMTASPGKPVANPAPGAFRSSGPQYVQGTWYERKIDLSAYNGQTVYIAFRHFDTEDQFYLNLDNVKVVKGIDTGVRTYTIYEGDQTVATGLTSPQYTLTGVEPGTHSYCVTAVYDGVNESEAVCVDATVDTPYQPVNLKAKVVADEITLTWTPQYRAYSTVFAESFESGIPAGWKNVDADGDDYKWDYFPGLLPAQDGNLMVFSLSYDALYTGDPLTPDNWLVTPAITLTEGNILRYYVNNIAPYPEHYGVYISTSDDVPGTFEPLREQTLASPPAQPVVKPALKTVKPGAPQYAQGVWEERTIDLSAYAGQTVYLAFRHFDTEDQFLLMLDNVKVLAPISVGDITYNISEGDQTIATGLTEREYTLTGMETGTYSYCVTAVYDGVNESEPACVDANVVPLSDLYRPVTGLDVTVTGPLQSKLTWEAPVYARKLRHHTYDSGTYGGVTINGTAPDIYIAARWTPDEIGNLDGLMLSKVRFIPLSAKDIVTYSVRVWVGGGNPSAGVYEPGELVVDQVIPEHTVGEWNEFALDTPVPIDPAKEIWIGFRCNMTAGGYPVAPRQVTSTLNGKGNLIYMNGAWASLTDLAPTLTGNWIIDGIAGYHQGLDATISLPALKDESGQTQGATLSASEGGTAEAFVEAAPPAVPAVAKYLINRDGVNIGEATTTTFTDDAMTVAAAHTYKVQVVYDDEGVSESTDKELTKTDDEIVTGVKAWLDEKETYTVNQATANTGIQVTGWLVRHINDLLRSSGVVISTDDVTIDAITPAVAGTESAPAGTSGSFAFTVSFALNGASETTGSLNGTITPITYTPPVAEEIFYTLNIPAAEGLITSLAAGAHAVSENTYMTLTFQAAEGYSIAAMRVYANGVEQTLTNNGEGLYELALGYLSGDVSITVDGIEEDGSVGIMASPGNGALSVVKADGGLYVYGLTPGAALRIYNVSGILVYQGKAADTKQFIPLRDRGFYIIVSDGSSVKAAL